MVRGALAAAPELSRRRRESAAEATVAPAGPPQHSLFPDRPVSKVIPFDTLTGGSARLLTRVETPPPATRPAAPARPQTRTGTPTRRAAGRKADDQHEFNFVASPAAPRTLKNNVQPSIYCDAPVANLLHRFLACTIDTCLVLFGYCMCLASYYFTGGAFPVNRFGYVTFAGAFVVMSLFYGLLWALAQTETPGMRWTRLRLTNFDGFAPDPGQRALRYFATALSFATCGFGLLWALFDEESLTWQDHISETFPTFQRAK